MSQGMQSILRRSNLAAFFLVILMTGLPSRASALTPTHTHEGPGKSSPAFTLKRVQLYIIRAREGESRIILPPIGSDHTNAAVRDAVENAQKAVERIRRHYPDFSDVEIVSQAHYLLQAVRSKGGRYTYRLSPEPGWNIHTTDDFEGILVAGTEDGQLSVELSVLHNQKQLFYIKMQMEPGRPLVFPHKLADGSSLFTVISTDTPDSSPFIRESGPDGFLRTGNDGLEAGSSQIHLHWDVPPKLIHYSQPSYPSIARRAGVEGYVTFHVVLGSDGKVEQAQVAESSPKNIFDSAAKEAILQWQYTPAINSGKPVKALFSQTVQFTLTEQGWRNNY